MNINQLAAGIWLAVCSLLFISCQSDDNGVAPREEKVCAVFNLSLDAGTRAAENFNPKAYDARMYLYEGSRNEDGTVGYAQVREMEVTDNLLEIEDLTVNRQYKAVFLAVPKGQTPGVPELLGADITPAYDIAQTPYINGVENETDKNIFRAILTFTASTNNSVQTTVLTRQNGALEVRLLNLKDVTAVSLHVKGHTSFLLQDGTGGQVITTGMPVSLSKTLSEGLAASDIRVRINLLPQEDITDLSGSDNFLEVTTGEGSIRYPIKSDHPYIPVYPNQVTWLTLGNAAGNFEVSFSGNINVDDNEWDGWNE